MCTTNTPIRLPGLTLAPLSPPPGPPLDEEGERPAPAPPAVAPEQVRPLDVLARALRSGAALAWERDCFILRDPGGAELARGVRLDELALVLGAAAGKAPKSPWTVVRLNRNLLLQVARVRNVGETLSCFLRESMRREIAARLAQDEAELQDQEEVRHAA